jgi:hypothetical protein
MRTGIFTLPVSPLDRRTLEEADVPRAKTLVDDRRPALQG